MTDDDLCTNCLMARRACREAVPNAPAFFIIMIGDRGGDYVKTVHQRQKRSSAPRCLTFVII